MRTEPSGSLYEYSENWSHVLADADAEGRIHREELVHCKVCVCAAIHADVHVVCEFRIHDRLLGIGKAEAHRQ